jgi:hypothetical protein
LKWHIELSLRTDASIERRKYEEKPPISESDKLFWADNKNRYKVSSAS